MQIQWRRLISFAAILAIINLVGDGWSGRPGPLAHQLLLLPVTGLFLFLTWYLLFGGQEPSSTAAGLTSVLPSLQWRGRFLLGLGIFQACAVLLIFYSGRHFIRFGYHLGLSAAIALLLSVFAWIVFALMEKRFSGKQLAWATASLALLCNLVGFAVAISDFPLNYLRSDMLPVILWADTNLLHHVDPYITMHVGVRTYDFPYLPGMIVAYFPFVAAHLDIRWGSFFYLAALALLTFWAARKDRRLEAAVVVGLFVLQPYLQYRHDLYLEPHWLTMVAAYVLMQRRRFGWAAVVFGISMAIYQFSWILFPFFLLNAFRRRGLLEAGRLTLFAAIGALAVAGPFLSSALHRIAHNSVGQWGAMARALADPMNLSYWATEVIQQSQLLRLQAILMVAIFAWAFFRGRCADLADTLRCSIAALTVFILFNSIIDGYFYLMLLVPMMLYVCAANGWWAEPTRKSIGAT